MLGWSAETALNTPIPEIELALSARYRFQGQQFRSLASLLGVKIKDEPKELKPLGKEAAAKKVGEFFRALAKKPGGGDQQS